MTKKFSTKVAVCAGATALFLSACSSSSSNSNSEPLTQFQTLGGAAQSQQSRVTNLPGTKFDAVPLTGEATFDGTGTVTMVLSEANDTQFRAIGDSTVSVNFATQAVTGGITNLMGVVGTTAEVNSASDPDLMVDVTGSIALSNGDIYELRRNRFGVDYAGTLTAGGIGYVIDNRATGEFRGTRADLANGFPVKAIQIIDQRTNFATTRNAANVLTSFAGTIGIYGETQ